MTTALDSSFFEFWIWTNLNSLLSIATNQFASFFINIRSRQCYFRVCQSGEISNKRAFFPCILIFLLYKTNRFHVAVRLFSNRSQRTSKCGKNISDTLGCASCATFLFLPHFDVICDLLLNRRTATWNLFVKWSLTNGFSKWIAACHYIMASYINSIQLKMVSRVHRIHTRSIYTDENQGGFYQNEVNTSLTFIKRPGN